MTDRLFRRRRAGAFTAPPRLLLPTALVLAFGPVALSAQPEAPSDPPLDAVVDTATAEGPEAFPDLDAPFGPLRVAERNPLYHLFLTPTVRGSAVLERGETRMALSTAYSNIFEYNASTTFLQIFDLERSSTVISLARGLGAGFEVGGVVGFQHNWGGFLDPAIQGLHELFGFPNADREKVQNGGFGIYLGSRSRTPEVFLDLPPGTGLEAPRVWAAWRAAGGARRAGELTFRTLVKLPFGDHRASSRTTDWAVEAAGRRSWGGTHLHLSAGVVRFGLPPRLEPIMRDGAWFGSVAVEQRVADGIALLAQFFGGSRYAAGFGIDELDNLPLNLSLGGRGRFGDAWSWQVSFTEDVPPNSPSVDFTVDLMIARSWSPGMDR
ncbi:DUF3187 family protein [Gaopeijia maritima]|uniref:DUF3187 family protein n=1 Tax=Gaopeijia maritima TaxID=3119007 RepID=UPI003252EF26